VLSKLHISSFIALTIGIWLIALWVQGMPVLSSDFIRPFSTVVGSITFFIAVFNKYVWAWPIFRGWYVSVPDLRGTWAVELKSNWIDPNTQKEIPPIQGYVVVRQTLTSLSIRLMTKESKSKVIAYSFDKESDGIRKVSAVYRNEPKIELQGNRSEIHHGSFNLEIYGVPASSLEGHYWTDRGTKGSMKLFGRKKKVLDTFEAAHHEFGAKSD
jgi:hypothetical protein